MKESISYQLRGTSGTGKTTVARALMKDARVEPIEWDDTRRNPANHPLVYHGDLFGYSFYVIGCYRNTNGGCDTIRKVQHTADLVENYLEHEEPCIVFFEGLMISHMLGTVGAMQLRTGQHRNILAFLDTPLELCLERVQKRRLDAGNTKPFNPANTIKDHPRVHQSKRNAISGGYTVTTVRHQFAYEDVLAQLEAAVNGLPLPGRLSVLD